MARTAITVNSVAFQKSNTITGSAADSSNGMYFENTGVTLLFVNNQDASAKEVTIKAVADEAGRTVDYVKSVGAGVVEMFGPYRPQWWNQSNGTVNVDFDADTSTTVAAVKIL